MTGKEIAMTKRPLPDQGDGLLFFIIDTEYKWALE